GIYGRRIDLRCVEAPERPEEWAPAARGFLQRQDAFALVAPFMARSEDEIADAARTERVPIVGPFAPFPKSSSPINRYVFYLHSGLADQARALAVFAGERLGGRKPSAAVLFSRADEAAAGEVRAAFAGLGWCQVEAVSVPRGAAAEGWGERLKE